MAVKIVDESAVLTLDFWEEEVIYCGKSFPAGSLACGALNIPGEVITQMETLCKKLNQFMGTFNFGKGDAALLPEARMWNFLSRYSRRSSTKVLICLPCWACICNS